MKLQVVVTAANARQPGYDPQKLILPQHINATLVCDDGGVVCIDPFGGPGFVLEVAEEQREAAEKFYTQWGVDNGYKVVFDDYDAIAAGDEKAPEVTAGSQTSSQASQGAQLTPDAEIRANEKAMEGRGFSPDSETTGNVPGDAPDKGSRANR